MSEKEVRRDSDVCDEIHVRTIVIIIRAFFVNLSFEALFVSSFVVSLFFLRILSLFVSFTTKNRNVCLELHIDHKFH